MTPYQIPIFVGIVGKRAFNDNPDENRRQIEIVQKRIDALLDRIDDEIPDVTKVFLTGGAAGADLISVRRVLGLDGARPRRDWLVALALPFSLELFREDFSSEAEWRQLSELLDHPRASMTQLPPLRTQLPVPDSASPGASPLSRTNTAPAWNDMRRRHYEQVGLWIADTANILIAVMPRDEPADKIGGTGRTIAFRRCGRPDPIAREIIDSSDVLAPRPELVRAPQQYVWLLDPASDTGNQNPPIAVLAPIVGPTALAVAYGQPGAVTVGGPSEHLQNSLAAARMIHRLAAAPPPVPDVDRAWPEEACPADVITKIRLEQRPIRVGRQQLSRHTFTLLAVLFVCTVLVFEVFAKFLSESGGVLLTYVVVMVSMLVLYAWAKRSGWQSDAEDFRALSELLRIQYAWWRAGLRTRVDFVHLQGADQDLGRVREGVRNAIVWARLATRDRCPRVDWNEVWAPADKNSWIAGQIQYFKDNEKIRERSAQRTNILSWLLFVTSFLLALLLLLWLSSSQFRNLTNQGAHAAIGCGPAITAAWVLLGIATTVLVCWGWTRVRPHLRGWQVGVFGGLATALTAAAIAGSLRLCGELLCFFFPHLFHIDAAGVSRYLVIIAIVLLPAIAGALRFRSEKLAYEAEVLSYREALAWFEHADELLGKSLPGDDPQSVDEQARTIVDRLGRLALAENEAWLKARRERPLTPIIGG